MYQYDDPTAAVALPTPAAEGAAGYFTDGSPTGGVPATILRADFMNMLQAELLSILTAAGITPSKTTYNQVLTATEIVNRGQSLGVVGSMRNGSMSVIAASASATFNADEIIVEAALGGLPYKLASFSKTINLGTTGAGGMDTGAAPGSGFVALYAIYNPTTQAAALLATNATSAAQPNIYGGANMPTGYTASALVSVWPTNSSGQFLIGYQTDRNVFITNIQVNTSVQQSSLFALVMSGGVPKNAKTVNGSLQVSTTSGSALACGVAGSSGGLGGTGISAQNLTEIGGSFFGVPLLTPQVIYYSASCGVGTMSFVLSTTGYTF